MHGLIRVRQFTISEGHLVLRPDQLKAEFEDCLNLTKYFLGTVGLLEDCTFRFSQWDPANTTKYEGTPEQWEEAQGIMKEILDELGVEYQVGVGEAAFAGETGLTLDDLGFVTDNPSSEGAIIAAHELSFCPS